MTLAKELVRELRERLGEGNVLEDAADRYVHGFDATATPRLPEVVVIPPSPEDLAWTCRALWREGVAVTPRGAGTGYSGGAVPAWGGAVVVCDRLKHISLRDGATVEVGPGVVGDELNRFLAARRLFYPVDPASAEVSTLGGHVAENAGGPRALKYGVTRDYVRALEVISPGRGRETCVAGPGRGDVLSLLVGSEGTLAVFLNITLRVLPKPPATAAVVTTFDDGGTAAAAAVEVLNAGIVPAKLEFLDRRCIECVNAKEPGTFEGTAALLFEFDGCKEEVAAALEETATLARAAGAEKVRVAPDEAAAAKLWQVRRGVSSALGVLAPHKTNEDVCVPLSKIPTLLGFISRLEEDYDIVVPTFGHIGDGNVHVNFMYDRGDVAQSERVTRAVGELMAEVIALGGTITGEHGVGLAKAAFLPLEQSPAELEYARRVKSIFDAGGLVNPGKIF